MKKLELLAPAGNYQSFLVALNNGADAIYLGIDEFNARGNIENFNLENIGEVVKTAHLFGVKIYVTLNILISDSEMSEVVSLAGKLLEVKVDAFIIQDLGLAMAIKNIYPNAVLHASTQMGICNLEGAQFVKKLGFTRVVLARETPLEEIRRIHENCDIEIEYFVQGALCVAYSGNCYFSSLEASASGNRGKCKQFCRLPYKLYDGKSKKEGYLLSAKDFCMLDKLPELAKAGVCSFKIEGRARRAGYVGQVVSVYKKAIENLDKALNTKPLKEKLKTAFNRGNFIEGYFNDDKKIDSQIQGHRGLEIGKVTAFKKGNKFNVITVEAKHKIVRGDGLKFLKHEREVASIGVNDVKELKAGVYQITTLANVEEGCVVCLTLDKSSEEELLKKQRKINLKAFFVGKIGEKASLTLKAFDCLEITVNSEEVLESAQNSPLSVQEIQEQLAKGSEIFDINLEDANLESVFMRKASLNELRRKAVQSMKEKLLEEYNKNLAPFVKKDYSLFCVDEKKEESQILIFSDWHKLDKQNLTKRTKLVYNPETYLRQDINEFCQAFKDFELYLDTPIIAKGQDIELLKIILQENLSLNIYANNYYGLNLMKGRKIIASNNLNVYNSQSVKFLKEEGVEDVVVSIESKDRLKNSGANLYALEGYRPTFMTLLHCPFKEHLGSVCQNCGYHNGVTLAMQSGKRFELKRKKLVSCLFNLVSNEILPFDGKYFSAKLID